MLKTRIITAVILLLVLLAVLFSGSALAFGAVVTVFLSAAMWECFRLFGKTSAQSVAIAAVWAAVFVYSFLMGGTSQPVFWFALAVMLWLIRFFPGLAIGLPAMDSNGNTWLSLLYAVSIVSCFAAIITLFTKHSALYLLSVMALVWIADIGAYFSGRAFGKRKLAPTISPGKSWEGAIGGGIAVLLISAFAILCMDKLLADTFVVHLQAKAGWLGTVAVLLLITAASVIGDLVESQLKRRAGFKDSSNLLPGHGGVLDRIDALIPVLPLAALIDIWLI
jgi:phosphatidate cytidylyltransferase